MAGWSVRVQKPALSKQGLRVWRASPSQVYSFRWQKIVRFVEFWKLITPS